MPNEVKKTIGWSQNPPRLDVGPTESWWEKYIGPKKKRTTDIDLPADSGVGKHPYGVSESMLEKIIKKQGMEYGTLIPEDMSYLEQYLHPQHDVLRNQPLRPTIGKPLNIPHKHIESTLQIAPDPKMLNKAFEDYEMGRSTTIDFTKMPHVPKRIYNTEGLGIYKDDTSNPNYDSIYDVWDFKTKHPMFRDTKLNIAPSIDNMAKEFMKRIGSPYAVYERIPKRGLDYAP